MKKVIFDCDNTMGVYGKDVDDGLTFLYLLGSSSVELIGVTTTFGNSDIETVHSNTVSMADEIGASIPILRGAGASENRDSEASRFLLEYARSNPGQLTVLATGSLTNLYGAYLLDENFFGYLKEVVVMGGIMRPLVINGKIMDELNFSSDPLAAYSVLKYGSAKTEVTVITGHICLQALFGKDTYDRLMDSPSSPVFRYIKEKTLPWFEFIGEQYGIEGFYNWDIVAGVYLTNPDIFSDSLQSICSHPDDMGRGLLKPSIQNCAGYILNIPSDIVDLEQFNNLVFSAWESAF